MEFMTQLERTVLGWLQNVPHLPEDARKWLGDNAWWIIAIAAAISGLAALGFLVALLGHLSALTSPMVSYFASSTFIVWVMVKTIVALVFTAIVAVLFANAITPLKQKQKKGWVLIFAALLVTTLSVVINAVLTFNVFSFLTSIIFGGVMLAVWAYFVFEIHNQFAHVERSKGVKAKK